MKRIPNMGHMEGETMFDYSKSFWGKKKADDFVEYLKSNGHDEIQIWQECDRINRCTVYIVKWN